MSSSVTTFRVLAFAGLVCASGTSPAQSLIVHESAADAARPDAADFVMWAKESFVPMVRVGSGTPAADLEPLGKMIGEATLVALSEGAHMGAEPLEFRNRLLQYLVEEKGFTAIALESGIVESRTVYDYVRGAPGDLPEVLAQGISWTFDQLPQNRDLIRWLRHYNADPRHVRKVNFYGFDISGSPGNPDPHRALDAPLAATLDYLARVDWDAASAFRARLDDFLISLRVEFQSGADSRSYDRLPQVSRDSLTAAIADLIALLERSEAPYIAARGTGEYEWAHRSAIAARQVDNWLRRIPPGWHLSGAPDRQLQRRFEAAAIDVRDRVQADNLEWIVAREGRDSKVLIHAHRYHLSAAPVRTSDRLNEPAHQTAATYLRRRFGDRLFTIGNLIAEGSVGCGAYQQEIATDPLPLIGALVARVAAPSFLLDLRPAPTSVRIWLDQEHQLGTGDDLLRMNMRQAYEALLFMRTITPACGGVARAPSRAGPGNRDN